VLACPYCSAEYPARTWLWHADRAWTYERWVGGRSPCCARRYHVELRGTSIAVGTLVGMPGPCFVAASEVEVPGLGVRYLERAIQLTLGDEHRVVAERDD
jgi:hypothetical protein